MNVLGKISSYLLRYFGAAVCQPKACSVYLQPVSFYSTCEVELLVVPVLSFSRATRVRISMLIGWHSNRAIRWLPFSREWRCERVGPRYESFLHLIRAVIVGNLTARRTHLTTRLTLWLHDELIWLPDYLFSVQKIWLNFSSWSTCWATALRGLQELWCHCLHQWRTLCVKPGGQYFRVARINETVKRVEVWTQQERWKRN